MSFQGSENRDKLIDAIQRQQMVPHDKGVAEKLADVAELLQFETDPPGDVTIGILSAQEGKYVNGQWSPGRWLNGDQTHQGRHIRLPAGKFDIQRVRLYRYR